MTFATMAEEFKALNTELVGLSVDSLYAHIAWLRKIQEIEWNGMKNVEVKFPLIEDIRMDVAKKFGMIQPGQSNTQAVRAVFVIDPEGTIRTILYYPLSMGRNFDEIKRIILALQKADKDKVATPANWRPVTMSLFLLRVPAEPRKREWKARTRTSIVWIGLCASAERRNNRLKMGERVPLTTAPAYCTLWLKDHEKGSR
jgi:alkyl hydroperoxide reductase subunit AhpC